MSVISSSIDSVIWKLVSMANVTLSTLKVPIKWGYDRWLWQLTLAVWQSGLRYLMFSLLWQLTLTAWQSGLRYLMFSLLWQLTLAAWQSGLRCLMFSLLWQLTMAAWQSGLRSLMSSNLPSSFNWYDIYLFAYPRFLCDCIVVKCIKVSLFYTADRILRWAWCNGGTT